MADRPGEVLLSMLRWDSADSNVVHLLGGNPKDWVPHPGKTPSAGTVQYVLGYLGDDEGGQLLLHVFPDWVPDAG